MTVAVAVRKNGAGVMAADSLVNFGGQRFPTDNCRFHKIYPIGDSLMVWAGWSLYGEMLDAWLGNAQPPSLSTERDVFLFFIQFWRAIRSEYTFVVPRADSSRHPFVSLDSVFLLLNQSGIYRIAGDMDVTQFEQYCAIGSGADYALGALRVLYDQPLDAAEIARRAVQVGIDFDTHCGGPIDLVELPVATDVPKGE